jgi:beta-aspartyl-peptidase (threonine type)
VSGLLLLHGGLGQPANEARRRGLLAAADAGCGQLAGAPLDAAVAAVAQMEADEEFNAGRGAVLNSDGDCELDACVVDGAAGRWAGISGLCDTVHAVRVARRLLAVGSTVLLAGAGATRFARDNGFGPAALETPRRREQWRAWRRSVAPAGSDTVGCVAADDTDRIAAASSSGGLTGKPAGRIGDAAVAGTGVYADTGTAVLCAGTGEASLTGTLALRAALLAEGSGAAAAAELVTGAAGALGAEIGVLVYDHRRAVVAVRHNADHFTALLRAGGHDVFLAPERGCTQVCGVPPSSPEG